jgi:hypothetical protein
MTPRARNTAVSAVVAIAALASAGSASAATLHGTVVHRSARAHSFVIANRAGHLTAVHARRSPRTGHVVTVVARRLHNGTFQAKKIRSGKTVHRTKLHGVVTYVDRAKKLFVLSGRGVSLIVHRAHLARRARAAVATDPATTIPSVGSVVTVDADVDEQGDVEANNVHEEGQQTGVVDIEGKVLAVDVPNRKLTISADDDDATGGTITVILPAIGFDPAAFKVGDEVELRATLNPDGTFTAVASSEDDNEQDADSTDKQQGDKGELDHHSSTQSGSSDHSGKSEKD